MPRPNHFFDSSVHPLGTFFLYGIVARINKDLCSTRFRLLFHPNTIFFTRQLVFRSIRRACHFNESAASHIAFKWQCVAFPDKLSMDVTNYLSPPTNGIFISATSVCNTAPVLVSKFLRDYMGLFVIVPSTQGE